MAQTILGLPSEWVFEHMELPETIRHRWEGWRMRQVFCFYQLLKAQNELIRQMKSGGIAMAIMKGAAAAMYYPDPSARTMGDIDFLVSQDEFEKARHLMLDHGYRLLYDEHNMDYHITLKKDAFLYEMHKRPAGMPDGTEGEFLQQTMEDGLQSWETVLLDGYEVPVLPAMQNGLVLLLHIVKHLKKGLGLRQIIDWMMYVNRELRDDTWYGRMQPILEKTKFETLAKAVTRMCQMYLGLNEAEITWCADISEDVCRELMAYIMQQGNFGRKAVGDDKSISLSPPFCMALHDMQIY